MNERERPDGSGSVRPDAGGLPPVVGLGTSELLHALRARILQVGAIVGSTVLVVAILTAVTPPRYTATAAITVGFGGGNPFEPLGTSVQHVSKQLSDAYMTTQADIVESHNVARKVVARLGLDTDSGFVDLYRASGAASGGTIEDWIAGSLLENLKASPLPNSRIIHIEFRSTDPYLATDVANAFAESYIDADLELLTQPAERRAAWFDDQLGRLRQRVVVSQASLTEYQQAERIVATEEQVDTETQRLSEISLQLIDAQADGYDVESSPLGRNHPDYLRVQERIRSLESALARQKQKVLDLKAQRSEIERLVADVESAQATYETATQRYQETVLESEVVQTNAAILNRAILPGAPSSPKVALNMILGTLAGILVAMIYMVVAETMDRRVRREDDLLKGLNVPVLGSL